MEKQLKYRRKLSKIKTNKCRKQKNIEEIVLTSTKQSSDESSDVAQTHSEECESSDSD